MSDINDGGPAFPNAKLAQDQTGGMTLRDWFAGQALTGSIATSGSIQGVVEIAEKYGQGNARIRADYCYAIADAMLALRKKPNEHI